jgi:hypothetical protein
MITMAAVLVVVGAVYSPFSTKAVRFATAMCGVLGLSIAVLYAIRAHESWGIRRTFEAALRPPRHSELVAERRRYAIGAAVTGGVACFALGLMWIADEYRRLVPIVVVAFLGGCAGALHYLLVYAMVHTLVDDPETTDGAADRTPDG